MNITDKEIKQEFFLEKPEHVAKVRRALEEIEKGSREYLKQQGIPIQLNSVLRAWNAVLSNLQVTRGDMVHALEKRGFKVLYGRSGCRYLMHPEDFKKTDLDTVLLMINASLK